MNKAAEITSAKRKNTHTISLLVANKPGVLVRISLVFARRGYNIDALVVSPTVDPRFSRMTITAKGDVTTLEQIIKQTGKLIDVLHVEEHTDVDAIEKELALFKIRYKSAQKPALQNLIKKFHAHAVDTTDESMIIEQTGSTWQVDELEEKLKSFKLIEMVRTGKVVVARGNEPT
ncbi:MAG: acetolactate synthase small subunit [Candidatus Omnitrophota bacterium]